MRSRSFSANPYRASPDSRPVQSQCVTPDAIRLILLACGCLSVDPGSNGLPARLPLIRPPWLFQKPQVTEKLVGGRYT